MTPSILQSRKIKSGETTCVDHNHTFGKWVVTVLEELILLGTHMFPSEFILELEKTSFPYL